MLMRIEIRCEGLCSDAMMETRGVCANADCGIKVGCRIVANKIISFTVCQRIDVNVIMIHSFPLT